MIMTLQHYWAKQNCILMQAYDVEKGAGTMSPMTLLRSLGPEPWNVAYVEPSRRPDDGRYGENPNRLYQHHQYQVIMKPSPDNIQDLYLDSLIELGINPLHMIFGLLKIIGKTQHWELRDLVGKYGLMEWKLLNLRIFNKLLD